jgi:hypothetical protein
VNVSNVMGNILSLIIRESDRDRQLKKGLKPSILRKNLSKKLRLDQLSRFFSLFKLHRHQSFVMLIIDR